MKTDNELIAEFMGAEFVRKPDIFYPDRYNETYIFQGHPGNWRVEKEIRSHLTEPMLCYHTDWDWLMPVVEKINKVDIIDMRREQLQETIWRYVSKVQILDAHMYVVEFIKWYNNQNP